MRVVTILIPCILLLCSFEAKTQNIIVDLKEEFNQVLTLHEEGKYEEVVSKLEVLIPETEKVYTDTARFYEMINTMGLSLFELKKYTQAEVYLTKTTQFYTSKGLYHPNSFDASQTLGAMYFGLNNFSKSEKYFRIALANESNLNGEKTENYAVLLQNLANSCTNQYKLKTVDSLYQIIIQHNLELYGEKSIEYATSLKALADLQKSIGKTADATSNYVTAKKILKEKDEGKNKDYLKILNSLAGIEWQAQKLANAEVYFNEMADAYQRAEGTKSDDYANVINNLAALYKQQNKFEQAERLLEKTLRGYKNSVGEKHPLFIKTLIHQADLYRVTGQYNKAEQGYEDARKLLFETVGEKNIEYANLLNNLGLLFDETGRYTLAEENFKKCLTITKDIQNDKSSEYATTLGNLAMLYENMGEFEVAEPMFKEALAIHKEVSGENHHEYATSLNNLAEFYERLNRIKDAEPLYLKAAQINKTIYGEMHYEYAICLNNLANLYEETDQLDKAEKYYNDALSIMSKVLGESHAEYANTLHNLAFLYTIKKDSKGIIQYNKAEELYKKDLDIIQKNFGTSHIRYAKAMSNMGSVYEHTERYAEAEKSYLEVIRIRKEKLGDHHPDYTYSLSCLARVYTAEGKYSEANTIWKTVINNYKEEIKKYFPSMSEKEKTAFYAKFTGKFEAYNSFVSDYYLKDPSVLSDMYNTQLATKAILFNSSNKVRQRILGSNDPALIELFKKWQSDKEKLAQLYVLPKEEVKINLDSLEKKTNELEKSLSLKSELFKSATEVQATTWQEVQKAIKPGQAAIEIIRFSFISPFKGGSTKVYRKNLDSVHYAALIITPETKDNPKMVLLTNGGELERRYIVYYRNAIRFNVSDEFCYSNYWSKIANELNGIKKVYFSPDGIYNNINLLSVYNPATKQYILDEIEIHTLSNTKDLLTANKGFSSSKKIVLIGDPDFGTLNTADKFRSSKLNRLPGSGVEVKKIAEIVNKNTWAENLFTGSQSTEEIVKSVRDVRVLHIATHGYFEADAKKSDSEIKENLDGKQNIDNPLLKSGLYLSKSTNDGEDGELSALEAMNLSLDNTELVVLSACETGLGEVKNGEGVYGIQRAFRVAGAKAIIISLWKVNDDATQKLMTYFYEDWFKTGDKRTAFKNAQNKLRLEFKDPQYWGAFIMVGE